MIKTNQNGFCERRAAVVSDTQADRIRNIILHRRARTGGKGHDLQIKGDIGADRRYTAAGYHNIPRWPRHGLKPTVGVSRDENRIVDLHTVIARPLDEHTVELCGGRP